MNLTQVLLFIVARKDYFILLDSNSEKCNVFINLSDQSILVT